MFEFEKNCPCVITEGLKERFCKDRNLPIKIFEEPYFSDRLALFDSVYHCISDYKIFVDAVARFGSEQKYFEQYNALKDAVITYLNDNPVMQYFTQKEDMNKYACKNVGYPTHSIYKETFRNRVFISIDMKKANFTALHHYDPRIVNGMNTYEEFLGTFTDEPHFINSKYIRQVVFGNASPKRQTTYEKYLMDTVLTKFFEIADFMNEDEKKNSVVFFSTDEIVLEVPAKYIDKELKHISSRIYRAIEDTVLWAVANSINVRAEVFELKKVVGTDGYVKEFWYDRSGYDFKCLDFLTFPFVIRKMRGEKVKETDRVFLYEGRKVKLIEDIEVSIE